MDNKAYLEKTLPKWVDIPKHNLHLLHYNWIRTKRFLVQSLMIFIFQYLTIIYLPITSPALPMYPPVAIAFVTFYLLGNSSLWGLLLGGLLGYFLKGLSPISMLLYLLADIGAGYLGARLCQNTFTSDIRPFAKLPDDYQFIILSTFITCLLSSLIRITAVILSHPSLRDPIILVYHFIDLWMADLNAILIFSVFLLSWVYIPFSREKISVRPLKKLVITTLLFIIVSLLLIQKVEMIYLIIMAAILSIYLSHIYGYLIASALLFIISGLYLCYFIINQQEYLRMFGLVLYSLAPGFLLLYSILIIYTFSNKGDVKPKKP